MSLPNPPRRSWFAVWRWRLPWRVWCLAALSLPVVYFLSAVPFLTLAMELTVHTGQQQFYLRTSEFNAPVFWMGKQSEFAGLVIAWQQHVMLSVFGRSA